MFKNLLNTSVELKEPDRGYDEDSGNDGDNLPPRAGRQYGGYHGSAGGSA